MEDRNRKAEWSFKLIDNIGAFEQNVHEEFPFDDALYYIAWQKQDERCIQGVIQLTQRQRHSTLKKIIGVHDIHLTPISNWENAWKDLFGDVTSETVEHGSYVPSNQKISNAMISKNIGCSLSSLRNMSKEQRIETMRNEFIASNDVDQTLMGIYTDVPTSMFEAEMALKQATLAKKLMKQERFRRKAEEVIMRPWQLELEKELQNPADPRNVIVYVDPVGNRGKSFFKKIYAAKYPKTSIYYEEGKSSSIKHIVATLPYEPRVIFLDLSRQIIDDEGRKNFINYELIESLKNGSFTSSKYTGACAQLDEIPHFVIFSNHNLNWNCMSRDRWILRKFKNDHDVEEFRIGNITSKENPKWIPVSTRMTSNDA